MTIMHPSLSHPEHSPCARTPDAERVTNGVRTSVPSHPPLPSLALEEQLILRLQAEEGFTLDEIAQLSYP